MNHGNDAFDYTLAERGLLGPQHRWKTAQQLPPCRFDRRVQRSDEMVQAAYHFQQLVERGPVGVEHARAMYPKVAAAVLLEGDPAKLEKLKVAVLGDLPPAEIARRLGVDEGVLKTWEGLFYDDVRGCRNAVGWFAAHVIGPELAAGRSELAAKLKLVAAVGSVGAQAVLAVGSRVPVTAGEHLFQRKLRLHLKYDQAMSMTEGPEYHFRFARLYTNLKMQENRLKVEEAKLGERCNAALRKHELAQIRIEADLERAKCRAARETRKAEELALRKEGERYARELAAARLRGFELAEEQKAVARAATSPLARLRWTHREPPQGSLHRRTPPAPNAEHMGPAEMLTSVPFWTENNWTTDGAAVAMTV